MAFSMQASSMVSLSKPDSLTMNHGTVWTVRVDTIWPDSVPRFVCSKSGKEYCASWPSNCLNLDKTNPWGAGQMAHGRQKCKSMCSHSWSVSQRSYLGLVRCPAGEGYRWNRPVTSHIHLLPPSDDSVPFVLALSAQNPSSGHLNFETAEFQHISKRCCPKVEVPQGFHLSLKPLHPFLGTIGKLLACLLILDSIKET